MYEFTLFAVCVRSFSWTPKLLCRFDNLNSLENSSSWWSHSRGFNEPSDVKKPNLSALEWVTFAFTREAFGFLGEPSSDVQFSLG